MIRIRRALLRLESSAAATIVDFSPSMSWGFTRYAWRSSLAAPVNSLSTRAPVSPSRQATYSLATRFMPSRRGVTTMTSAARYMAAISSRG